MPLSFGKVLDADVAVLSANVLTEQRAVVLVHHEIRWSVIRNPLDKDLVLLFVGLKMRTEEYGP